MSVVAVTAAGGGVGQSIIKALKGTKYRTVAIDPSDQAAGLYMADAAHLGLGLKDEGFIERLLEICRIEGCKYLFSGFDAELPILARNRTLFSVRGITVIVSPPEVIELSDKKKALVDFLAKNNFPYIPTEYIPKGKYILKPNSGCRSQNIQVLNIEEDLLRQEFIDGPEYTCGTVSFDGNVLGVIAMVRELRNGDTYKARVDQNPTVIKFATELIQKIKPFGPCNIQLRLRDNIPYVLEINARCSGTTAARALAGFNEPKMVLDYLEGLPVDYTVEPVEILRYWDEVVVRPVDRERISS